MTREQFNEMYWAAQPPEVRALRDMPVGTEKQIQARQDAADKLAQQGFVIDNDIHGYDRDPFMQMIEKRDHGYTWYPARLQTPNYDLPPGVVGLPGNVISGGTMWPNRPYDPNKPMPGSIKVSLDPADYPPFDKAPAPPPPIPQGVPGVITGRRTRGIIPGDNSPDGTKWTDVATGRVWVKRFYANPFGGGVQWELEGE